MAHGRGVTTPPPVPGLVGGRITTPPLSHFSAEQRGRSCHASPYTRMAAVCSGFGVWYAGIRSFHPARQRPRTAPWVKGGSSSSPCPSRCGLFGTSSTPGGASPLVYHGLAGGRPHLGRRQAAGTGPLCVSLYSFLPYFPPVSRPIAHLFLVSGGFGAFISKITVKAVKSSYPSRSSCRFLASILRNRVA